MGITTRIEGDPKVLGDDEIGFIVRCDERGIPVDIERSHLSDEQAAMAAWLVSEALVAQVRERLVAGLGEIESAFAPPDMREEVRDAALVP